MSNDQNNDYLLTDKQLWSNETNLDWNNVIVENNNLLKDNLKDLIEKFNSDDFDSLKEIISKFKNNFLVVPFSKTLVEETDVSFDNAFDDFSSLVKLLNYLKDSFSLIYYQENSSKFDNELKGLTNEGLFEFVILGNSELASEINNKERLVFIKDDNEFNLLYDIEDSSLYSSLVNSFITKFNKIDELSEEIELNNEDDLKIEDELINTTGETVEEDVDLTVEEDVDSTGEELVDDIELESTESLEEETLEDILLEEQLDDSEVTDEISTFVKEKTITNETFVNITKTKKGPGKVKSKKKKVFLFILLYIILLAYVNALIGLYILNGVSENVLVILIALAIVLNLFVLTTLKYARKKAFKKVVKQTSNVDANLFDSLTYIEPISVESYEVELEVDTFNEESILNDNDLFNVNYNPKKYSVDSSNYIYGDINNVELYLDNLHTYLNGEELSVNASLLRTFFANFMASRMIVLNEVSNANLNLKFLDTFSNYIGSNITYLNLADCNDTDLQLLNNEDINLSNIINNAKSSKEQVNIAVLYNVDLTDFDNKYQNILNYALNPFVPASLDKELGKLSIPSNLWFVVVPSNNHFELNNHSLLLSSFVTRLDVSLVEKDTFTEENNYKLSTSNIEELLRNSLEDLYLSERVWKRLDEFSSLNNEVVLFDNRVVTQIENMTAIYKLSNGNDEELIDNILATKILPLVYSFLEEKNIDVITSLLEKLFNLEDLRQSQIYLNNIKSTINNK